VILDNYTYSVSYFEELTVSGKIGEYPPWAAVAGKIKHCRFPVHFGQTLPPRDPTIRFTRASPIPGPRSAGSIFEGQRSVKYSYDPAILHKKHCHFTLLTTSIREQAGPINLCVVDEFCAPGSLPVTKMDGGFSYLDIGMRKYGHGQAQTPRRRS
jgi:hypothetical protein